MHFDSVEVKFQPIKDNVSEFKPANQFCHQKKQDDVFASIVDGQIAAIRESMERTRLKLAVLEELRRAYSAGFNVIPSDGKRLPPLQLLVVRVIGRYLKNQVEPVPTRVLLSFLAEQGIKFGGRQPRNSLSVLLSRSKRFVAHGHHGWTVVSGVGSKVFTGVKSKQAPQQDAIAKPAARRSASVSALANARGSRVRTQRSKAFSVL